MAKSSALLKWLTPGWRQDVVVGTAAGGLVGATWNWGMPQQLQASRSITVPAGVATGVAGMLAYSKIFGR
jgi:hypothetical protein